MENTLAKYKAFLNCIEMSINRKPKQNEIFPVHVIIFDKIQFENLESDLLDLKNIFNHK